MSTHKISNQPLLTWWKHAEAGDLVDVTEVVYNKDEMRRHSHFTMLDIPKL